MPDDTTPTDPIPWQALAADEVLRRLETSPKGLRPEEAHRRLALHGSNRLPPPKGRSPLTRFLLQFHNVLIYVLLASAGITLTMGRWADTSVIVGVVFINALVGFLQEGKAERALDAIRNMLSQQAVVLREGRRVTIAAEGLVPGDIVLLQAGDKVPADLRLLRAHGLQAEEAALTGESIPVDKNAAPSARFIVRPVFTWEGLAGNPYVLLTSALVIGFQLLFTYAEPMQQLFATVAIGPASWGRILMASAAILLLVEMEKWIWRQMRSKKSR